MVSIVYGYQKINWDIGKWTTSCQNNPAEQTDQIRCMLDCKVPRFFVAFVMGNLGLCFWILGPENGSKSELFFVQFSRSDGQTVGIGNQSMDYNYYMVGKLHSKLRGWLLIFHRESLLGICIPQTLLLSLPSIHHNG